MSYLQDGRRIIVNILGPGDYWGWLEEPGGGESGDEALTLRAATEVVCLSFDREYFEGMLARRPYVALEVARMLGLRTRRYELRIASLIYQNSRQKLASLLLELTKENPKDIINLSHEQLGAIVGLSREQVTRLLGDFTCAGHISSSRRRIAVLNRAGLRSEKEIN